jgi:hypothetical protein
VLNGVQSGLRLGVCGTSRYVRWNATTTVALLMKRAPELLLSCCQGIVWLTVAQCNC